MTRVAVYAQRLAALPRALSILELHPQGLPLADLAAELGVAPADLREVFMAYYLADLVELGNFSLPVVEFFAPGGDGDWVRVLAPDPEHELGVDHLTAGQLAALYAAAVDLLALEPSNDVLRAAAEAFEAALAPADKPVAAQWGARTARALHRAAEEHRRVRVTYARQWQPGTRTRVVEPYRLVRTRRGWELDAGPADERAAVRTYLVSGIVDHQVTDETFEPPADLDRLLAANRAAVTVRLVVPQGSRWAVERFAESTAVLDDDESDVALRADLLPPVDQRLGLLMLCCGPEAFVTAPDDLREAGSDMAMRLLEHHAGRQGPEANQGVSDGPGAPATTR